MKAICFAGQWNHIVQRGIKHNGRSSLPTVSRSEDLAAEQASEIACQTELVRDLTKILEQLDAMELPLAAIHVHSAIGLIKNTKA